MDTANMVLEVFDFGVILHEADCPALPRVGYYEAWPRACVNCSGRGRLTRSGLEMVCGSCIGQSNPLCPRCNHHFKFYGPGVKQPCPECGWSYSGHGSPVERGAQCACQVRIGRKSYDAVKFWLAENPPEVGQEQTAINQWVYSRYQKEKTEEETAPAFEITAGPVNWSV